MTTTPSTPIKKKRKKPVQLAGRAMADLRAEGYSVAVVERYNSFTKQKNDLFGMFDLLAIRGPETIGVQVTSGDHHAERVQKIRDAAVFSWWLQGGTRQALVMSYAKQGARGARKLWTLRRERIEG